MYLLKYAASPSLESYDCNPQGCASHLTVGALPPVDSSLSQLIVRVGLVGEDNKNGLDLPVLYISL